jgi:ferredoxin
MKIKFVPQNIEVEGTPEKSLLQIATENNIEIKSICKGVPSCAECRVRLTEGENNVVPPNKAELNLIGTNWHIDSRRLSCQVRCFGDVTVDLTEQLERQENQTKKVRGFRSQRQQHESHAVQDTMLLVEKPEDKRADDRGGEPKSTDERSSEPRNQEQRNQDQRNADGRQQQPRNKQNNDRRPNNERKNNDRNRGGGGGGNRKQDDKNKRS